MDRRGFLKLAAKAAVTAAGVAVLGTEVLADPERAVWVPGKKRIFDFGGMGCLAAGTYTCRFDVHYGFATLRPDLAIRVWDGDLARQRYDEHQRALDTMARKFADSIDEAGRRVWNELVRRQRVYNEIHTLQNLAVVQNVGG